MGGGDLNLKKSWHPTTLKNMERVWKAEQKHEAECKKIEELQKELAEERAREEIRQYAEDKGVVKKKTDRLDWMYEGPASHINREEYLLGRTVDKTFELLQQQQETSGGDFKTEEDTMPESVARKPSVGNVTIDLANKIREDPLLTIKKQEEQSRKDLLDNPVRMKQLQMLLRQMSGSRKSKKKDKRKKSRKGKKSELSDRCSSEDELSRKRGRDRDTRRKRISDSRGSDKKHGFDAALPSRSHHHRRVEQKTRLRRSSSSSPPPGRSLSKALSDRKVRDNDRHRSQRRSVSPVQDNRKRNYDNDTGRSSARPEKSRKLDAAERERRLQEMVSNVKWRDELRDSNFKRHLEELKREKDLQEKTANVDIMTPMLHRAVNIGSVESRIKSNIYNIQRTKADLEKSFTKR